MRGRTDTPWYPTMRLFRQARHWEWGAPFAEMARELEHVWGTNGGNRS
jgi:hypothetical protein